MTPFEVLGIRPDATEREAEDAYNRLLRIHHPDLHQGGSAEEIAAAEAMTRALNAAMHQVRASFATAGGPAAANAPGGTGAGPTADGEARYRPQGDGTGPRRPGPGWGGHDADRAQRDLDVVTHRGARDLRLCGRRATTTQAEGVRPAARHLMSQNFSAPRSAPKPASVTT